MKKTFLIVIITFVVVVLTVNQFVDAPVFNDPKEKLEYIIENQTNDRLDEVYLELIIEDSLNIDYHYGFLTNHFTQLGGLSTVNEKQIRDIYWEFIEHQDSHVNDLGFYCLGLISSIKDDYNNALIFLTQVTNENLKYLNNSLGHVYEQANDLQLAEEHYLKEIANNGNVDGAYSNLIRFYYSNQYPDKLYDLLKDRDARKYFPSQVKRYLFLTHFNLIGYFEAVFTITYQNQSLIGFLGALLVMLSWLFYLRKIDIYEPERWKNIFFIFILGVIFSELTFLLSDVISMSTGFDLNGRFFNDLLYCIIGIGVIEELVKILPVIIILKYTKAINEPVDYLVYGSVSALGFAFAENLLYFNSYGPQIIMGRALTAVVFHMFLTSLAAYGLMLNKYKSGKGLVTKFTKYFILAAIVHGLYDFWLINPIVSKFGILSMIMLVFCFSFFNTLISNALSNSEFYDEDIHLNRRKLQNYLVYSLSFILMFQYLSISFKYGHEAGWSSLKSSLWSGGYLIIFISANLGTINIKHRKWKPLQIRFPRLSFKLDHDPKDVINSEFDISAISKNRDLFRILPNKGKVLKCHTISESDDWYLFELENRKEILEFNGTYIILKPKTQNSPIQLGKYSEVAVFVFFSDEKIHTDEILREDLLFKGWAKVK